jgi:beta-xylosidase
MSTLAFSRRAAMGALFSTTATMAFAGPALRAFGQTLEDAAPLGREWSRLKWARGVEGQRKADLGNGKFLNPIIAGDHPDPSIMKDGADYYMTHSSFESVPGLVIWHSRDLVNWTKVTAALTKYVGSVWAPDISKHNGRYFIYFPVKAAKNTNMVIWADRIEGPWSEPIDLNLGQIDPGHVVGEDGKRYLFLSGGNRVQLADDGLSTVGEVQNVYKPWHYPEDWIVEGFSPEGPKVFRRGDWFYLVTAVGGTAGPPTGHMVIAARSKSLGGPWEDAPNNPQVRTKNAAEKWWSRGHASLIEGPKAGEWWTVYHGYENAYWTLGRQTLLDRIEWTRDGWFEMKGGDLSKPMKKPSGGVAGPHGEALSDDFSTDKYGVQWSFFKPGPDAAARLRRESGTLHMKAIGTAPKDCSPLTFVQGEQAYEIECDIEIDDGVMAGMVLFYDDALYAGLGFTPRNFVTHTYGLERGKPANPHGKSMRMKIRNAYHNVTCYSSGDGGKTWVKFDREMEVSGYHQNVRGGFMALRPGIYAAGTGEARFCNFTFRAL